MRAGDSGAPAERLGVSPDLHVVVTWPNSNVVVLSEGMLVWLPTCGTIAVVNDESEADEAPGRTFSDGISARADPAGLLGRAAHEARLA
ncbi:hypothetical protein ACFT1B_35680 [Streptomyces griseoincarnatus]|uniref:hypothetical protein n=1 Tax=Promicromonospora sp. NPDC057138 TaxID=3346031 RepID=UPI00363812B6